MLERSIRKIRRLAAIARRKAGGRGARAKLKAARELEEMRIAARRSLGRSSSASPASRSRTGSCRCSIPTHAIRKGKLGKPNELGFVSQLAEVTENTKRGARGWTCRPRRKLGNPAEDTLLPGTVAELTRLAISVREVVLDGWFNVGPTTAALEDLQPQNVFIAGRQKPASKRTTRRMRRYRTGAKGRISHLKRRYALGRSRLKGDEGRQIWTEWAILAYNADTLAVRQR